MAPSAGDELRRALRAEFVQLAIESLASRSWASVTFSGARHRLVLRFEGEDAAAAADAFLDGLGEREVVLRGHILADIALVTDERERGMARLTVEALTVEAD
jgi:hypothetical protein